MNKKKMYLIGGVVFLCLVVTIFLFLRGGSNGTTSKPPAKNDPKVEARVTWLQKNVSVNFFSTSEDAKNDIQDIHVMFRSHFSYSTNSDVKSFKVKKVTFKQGVGTQLFIHPSDQVMSQTLQSFVFTNETSLKGAGIKDGGSMISYKVVDGHATRFNEVSKTYGLPMFGFISKNVGSISSESILKRDNLYEGAKLLQYANITAEQLNGILSFDIEMTFTDGKTYAKRFTGAIDGSKILNQTFYTIEMGVME